MEVLVPSQTPALVLPGGLEILAVKVCEICQGALTHTFARGMCPRTHFLSLFINPQHHSPSHVLLTCIYNYGIKACPFLAWHVSQCFWYKHTTTTATQMYLLYSLSTMTFLQYTSKATHMTPHHNNIILCLHFCRQNNTLLN